MSFDRPAAPLRSMCSFAPKFAPSSMMYWSEARKRLSISRSNVSINDPGSKLDHSRSSLVVANPSPSLSPSSPTAPSPVATTTPSLRTRLTEAKMNSSDSLNGDSSASQRSRSPIASGPAADLHQPGADTDTPRGGGSSVNSTISSPSSVRRADHLLTMGPPPPQHLHGHGHFPVPNQMLLDPSTGQHYIVPSQPQYLYQPVYLNPSPHGGPIYYQAASPAGPFLVTASRTTPAFVMAPSPAPSFGSSFNEQLLRQRHSTSSGEVQQDEKSEPDSGYFTRGHDSRISTESSKSAEAVLLARQRGRQSPPSPSSISLNSNTNGPNTTSFAVLGQGPQSPKKTQPTPMYGTQPSWWGRSESEERLDEETHRRASPRHMVGQSSPPPAPVSTKESHNESPPPSRPQLKPVRMDIDFNRPVTPEMKQDPKPRVTNATAFTVSFDEETPKKVTPPKSLQDAARQSTKARVMLRRSVQPKEAVIPENSIVNHEDPKRYLLSKMLQGDGSGSELITVAGDSLSTQKRDVDTLSDAGTYVVDEKDAFHLKLPMKQLDSDDDTATTVSSDSGSSSSKPRIGVFLPCTSTVDLAPQRRTIGADVRAISAARPSRKIDLPPPRPTPSSAPRPAAPGPATTNANFRRGDGGRYSMSVGKKAGNVSPGVGQIRPPFKAGLSSRPQSSNAMTPKDSAEMQGWLRRKEYNPMKSAAEGQKKMQQLKARSDNFTSSRSISFHHGSTPSYSGSMMNHDVKAKDSLNPRFLSKDDSIQNMQDVEKAVDELTVKCNKSIQLIRCSNQGLSDSVENLLKRAVDPTAPTGPETISNRLDRLNSTFDAIQKFLEEQQNSSPSRPVQRSFGVYRSRVANQQARSPSASRRFQKN
uniref:MIF4G domain-containing protein n=1 Tax=Steinernema glaseri TaxID=37863 RepID=A0A1I7XZY8_9BILA